MVFKQLLAKRITLIRLILSYVITGSMLIGIFSWVFILSVTNNTVRNTRENHQSILRQAVNSLEATVKYAHLNFIRKLSLSDYDSIIFQAMYSDSFSALMQWNINKALTDYAQTSSLIHSIYLYNAGEGLVFSNLHTTFQKDEFFDPNALKAIEENAFASSRLLPRTIPAEIGKTPAQVISFSVPGAAYGTQDKSSLIINLDQKLFQNALFDVNSAPSDCRMIVSSTGVVLTDSASAEFASFQGGDGFVKQILESENDAGSFDAVYNGQKILVSYTKDSTYQLCFITGDYYSKITGWQNNFIRTLSFVSAAFIFLSLILAGVFAVVFYRPMNRLLKKINPSGDKLTDKVYDLINTTLDRLEGDSYRYEQSRKSQFFRKLCCGELANEYELNTQLAELGTSLIGQRYMVLLLYVHTGQPEEKSERSLIRYAVMNIAKELLEQHFSLTAFEDEEDNVGIILAYDSIEKKALEQPVLEIIQNVKLYFEVRTTAFLGLEVNNLISVSKSYKASLDAKNYIMAFDENQAIIESSEAVCYLEEKVSYPIGIENKIIDAVKICDREETAKNLRLFVERIRTFSHHEIVAAVMNLLVTVSKQMMGLVDTTADIHSAFEYSATLKKVQGIHSAHELTDWLLSVCDEIIEGIHSKKMNRNACIALTMQQYIDENFTAPDLSTDSVARQVYLSTNYARIIFKEYTGVSISSYIADKRHEKACYLLASTKLPVAKVAQESGYSTAEYFFSSFKKRTGSTPGAYRKNI